MDAPPAGCRNVYSILQLAVRPRVQRSSVRFPVSLFCKRTNRLHSITSILFSSNRGEKQPERDVDHSHLLPSGASPPLTTYNCRGHNLLQNLIFLHAIQNFPAVRQFNCDYKGKSVPLQAWSGPEGSSKLRFPDFMTTAQDGGKVVSLTHRPPLPPGKTPGTHFC